MTPVRLILQDNQTLSNIHNHIQLLIFTYPDRNVWCLVWQGCLFALITIPGTTMNKFYRIKTDIHEAADLCPGFSSKLKGEQANDSFYLGVRFNPTSFERSAAINSLELAYACIRLFENTITDYGRVICSVEEYSCSGDFMQSTIDTDSRMLINHIRNSRGKRYPGKVGNNATKRNEAIALSAM